MTADAHSQSALSVPQFVDQLAQQRDLYRQLHDLSSQQAALIEAGQTEQLLTVLSQRQALIEQLGQVNQTLAPFRQQWPQLSSQISADERDRVNALLDEVESLLETIIKQDDQDRQQLAAAKTQVAGDMQQTTNAGRALNAYTGGPHVSPAARFTDRQG